MINNISYLPGLCSSDHVCLNFNLICYVHCRGTALKKYNIYLADVTKMRQTLETYNWDEALDQLNISEAWDYFYGVFNNLIGEYVPVSSSRNRKNIYITRKVIKLKNTKKPPVEAIFLNWRSNGSRCLCIYQKCIKGSY